MLGQPYDKIKFEKGLYFVSRHPAWEETTVAEFTGEGFHFINSDDHLYRVYELKESYPEAVFLRLETPDLRK